MTRSPVLLALAAAAILPFGHAAAQTCANPIPAEIAYRSYAGTTCGANRIPTIANGMLDMRGHDVVYRVHVGAPPFAPERIVYILTAAAGLDLSLALCTAPCGGSATCLAVVDSAGQGGTETLSLGATVPPPGDYYLLVDSSTPHACGTYSLVANGIFPE